MSAIAVYLVVYVAILSMVAVVDWLFGWELRPEAVAAWLALSWTIDQRFGADR